MINLFTIIIRDMERPGFNGTAPPFFQASTLRTSILAKIIGQQGKGREVLRTLLRISKFVINSWRKVIWRVSPKPIAYLKKDRQAISIQKKLAIGTKDNDT